MIVAVCVEHFELTQFTIEQIAAAIRAGDCPKCKIVDFGD